MSVPVVADPIASYPPFHASRGPIRFLTAGVAAEEGRYGAEAYPSMFGHPSASAGGLRPFGASSASAAARGLGHGQGGYGVPSMSAGGVAQTGFPSTVSLVCVGAEGARGWRVYSFDHTMPTPPAAGSVRAVAGGSVSRPPGLPGPSLSFPSSALGGADGGAASQRHGSGGSGAASAKGSAVTVDPAAQATEGRERPNYIPGCMSWDDRGRRSYRPPSPRSVAHLLAPCVRFPTYAECLRAPIIGEGAWASSTGVALRADASGISGVSGSGGASPRAAVSLPSHPALPDYGRPSAYGGADASSSSPRAAAAGRGGSSGVHPLGWGLSIRHPAADDSFLRVLPHVRDCAPSVPAEPTLEAAAAAAHADFDDGESAAEYAAGLLQVPPSQLACGASVHRLLARSGVASHVFQPSGSLEAVASPYAASFAGGGRSGTAAGAPGGATGGPSTAASGYGYAGAFLPAAPAAKYMQVPRVVFLLLTDAGLHAAGVDYHTCLVADISPGVRAAAALERIRRRQLLQRSVASSAASSIAPEGFTAPGSASASRRASLVGSEQPCTAASAAAAGAALGAATGSAASSRRASLRDAAAAVAASAGLRSRSASSAERGAGPSTGASAAASSAAAGSRRASRAGSAERREPGPSSLPVSEPSAGGGGPSERSAPASAEPSTMPSEPAAADRLADSLPPADIVATIRARSYWPSAAVASVVRGTRRTCFDVKPGSTTGGPGSGSNADVSGTATAPPPPPPPPPRGGRSRSRSAGVARARPAQPRQQDAAWPAVPITMASAANVQPVVAGPASVRGSVASAFPTTAAGCIDTPVPIIDARSGRVVGAAQPARVATARPATARSAAAAAAAVGGGGGGAPAATRSHRGSENSAPAVMPPVLPRNFAYLTPHTQARLLRRLGLGVPEGVGQAPAVSRQAAAAADADTVTCGAAGSVGGAAFATAYHRAAPQRAGADSAVQASAAARRPAPDFAGRVILLVPRHGLGDGEASSGAVAAEARSTRTGAALQDADTSAQAARGAALASGDGEVASGAVSEGQGYPYSYERLGTTGASGLSGGGGMEEDSFLAGLYGDVDAAGAAGTVPADGAQGSRSRSLHYTAARQSGSSGMGPNGGFDAGGVHDDSTSSAGECVASTVDDEEEEEAPIARSAAGLPRPAAAAARPQSRRGSGGALPTHEELPAPPSPAAYRDLWASPAAPHPAAGGPHAHSEGYGHSNHAQSGTGRLHQSSSGAAGQETQHSIVGARIGGSQNDATDATSAAARGEAGGVMDSGVDASFRSDASGPAGFTDPDAVTAELEALQAQMNAMRARLARQGEAGRRGPATAQIAAGGPGNRGEL